MTFLLSNHSPIHLHPLHRTRHIPLPRPNPMPHYARPQHVGHKLIPLPIPHKQSRARTSPPVDLRKILLPVARNVNFVLQHSSRPQHAYNVGLFRLAQSHHNFGRVLPQISIRSGNLNLLPIPSRKHLHLGSNRALVVVQSLQRKPQPMILIPALIA